MSASQSTPVAEVLAIDMRVCAQNADPGRESVTYSVSSMLACVGIGQRDGLRVSLVRGSDIVSFLNPEETLKDRDRNNLQRGIDASCQGYDEK